MFTANRWVFLIPISSKPWLNLVTVNILDSHNKAPKSGAQQRNEEKDRRCGFSCCISKREICHWLYPATESFHRNFSRKSLAEQYSERSRTEEIYPVSFGLNWIAGLSVAKHAHRSYALSHPNDMSQTLSPTLTQLYTFRKSDLCLRRIVSSRANMIGDGADLQESGIAHLTGWRYRFLTSSRVQHPPRADEERRIANLREVEVEKISKSIRENYSSQIINQRIINNLILSLSGHLP